MSVRKKSKEVRVESNRELIIDNSFFDKQSPAYLKQFNDYYMRFCDLNEVIDLNDLEKEQRLLNGVQAAIIVACSFDFSFQVIKENKSKYIKFARDMFYEAGANPNNNAEAMIYLIRGLYGETNIAYSHQGEHKVVNIEDGNEWVDYLEKYGKNRVLKAYALTLRCYQYIVNGEKLGMSVKQRINKSEKDLIYATKWDEDNYFAYYALGLIYLDSGTTKYNKDKAIANFKKVLSYENKDIELDKYLKREEKQKAMDNARRKIDFLNKQ